MEWTNYLIGGMVGISAVVIIVWIFFKGLNRKSKKCGKINEINKFPPSVILVLLFSLLVSGCLSSSSYTNSDLEGKMKGSQQSSQSSGQESSNTNNSETSIRETEYFDNEGKVVSRTVTTIAKTGSETNQQNDLLSKIKQDFEMKMKSDAEASAKAEVNFTYLFLGIGAMILIYLLISGGSRALAIFNKIRKPLS